MVKKILCRGKGGAPALGAFPAASAACIALRDAAAAVEREPAAAAYHVGRPCLGAYSALSV